MAGDANNVPNDASSAATSGCTQAAISLDPANHSFHVCRFLSDQDQRPPLGMKPAPSEAKAEAKMSVLLRELDRQFPPPGMGQAPSKAEAEAKMPVVLLALGAQFGNSPGSHKATHN